MTNTLTTTSSRFKIEQMRDARDTGRDTHLGDEESAETDEGMPWLVVCGRRLLLKRAAGWLGWSWNADAVAAKTTAATRHGETCLCMAA